MGNLSETEQERFSSLVTFIRQHEVFRIDFSVFNVNPGAEVIYCVKVHYVRGFDDFEEASEEWFVSESVFDALSTYYSDCPFSFSSIKRVFRYDTQKTDKVQ